MLIVLGTRDKNMRKWLCQYVLQIHRIETDFCPCPLYYYLSIYILYFLVMMILTSELGIKQFLWLFYFMTLYIHEEFHQKYPNAYILHILTKVYIFGNMYVSTKKSLANLHRYLPIWSKMKIFILTTVPTPWQTDLKL